MEQTVPSSIGTGSLASGIDDMSSRCRTPSELHCNMAKPCGPASPPASPYGSILTGQNLLPHQADLLERGRCSITSECTDDFNALPQCESELCSQQAFPLMSMMNLGCLINPIPLRGGKCDSDTSAVPHADSHSTPTVPSLGIGVPKAEENLNVSSPTGLGDPHSSLPPHAIIPKPKTLGQLWAACMADDTNLGDARKAAAPVARASVSQTPTEPASSPNQRWASCELPQSPVEYLPTATFSMHLDSPGSVSTLRLSQSSSKEGLESVWVGDCNENFISNDGPPGRGARHVHLQVPIVQTSMSSILSAINIKQRLHPLLPRAEDVSLWLGHLVDGVPAKGRFSDKVVLKIAPTAEAQIRVHQMCREVALLSHVAPHCNIVQLRSPFIYETATDHLCVLEYLHGPDLYELLASTGPQSEENTRRMVTGVLSGLMHLHHSGYAHLDIKPENLVLRDPKDLSSVCIIDFEASASISNRTSWAVSPVSTHETPQGNSPILSPTKWGPREGDFHFLNERTEDFCTPAKTGDIECSLHQSQKQSGGLRAIRGTLGYIAPEIFSQQQPLQNETHNFSADREYCSTLDKCDVYSLGIVMFMLLAGYHPFCVLEEAQNGNGQWNARYASMLELNKQGRIDGILENAVEVGDASRGRLEISSTAADLLRKMCDVNPVTRLSSLAALQHPWIMIEKN